MRPQFQTPTYRTGSRSDKSSTETFALCHIVRCSQCPVIDGRYFTWELSRYAWEIEPENYKRYDVIQQNQVSYQHSSRMHKILFISRPPVFFSKQESWLLDSVLKSYKNLREIFTWPGCGMNWNRGLHAYDVVLIGADEAYMNFLHPDLFMWQRQCYQQTSNGATQRSHSFYLSSFTQDCNVVMFLLKDDVR